VKSWSGDAAVFETTIPDTSRRVRMYANGSEIGATSYTAPGVGSALLKLGSSGTCPDSNRFTGLMDEVRIWTVARTQAQIQALENTCVWDGASGLVASYHFAETAQTVADGTSFHNNGTLGATSSVASDDPTRTIEQPSQGATGLICTDSDGDGPADAV